MDNPKGMYNIVCRYVLELDDADVYRLPYLDSSDPGFCKPP